MDKPWLVRYRQFSRGRRSVKTAPISAANQAEVLKIFNMAIAFCKKEDPFKFGHVKLISIFEEACSVREIKFRGKRTDNGEWVYGYYYYNSLMKRAEVVSFDDVRSYVYTVIPETVGQYTGLKDKNGKEIYEGDIIHCWGGECAYGVWEFDEIVTLKELVPDSFYVANYGCGGEYKVIGNTYPDQTVRKGGVING